MTIIHEIDGIVLKWNPDLHKLGSLCKRKHEWGDSGQSVRLIKSSICAVCCRKHGNKEYPPVRPDAIMEIEEIDFKEEVHFLGKICPKGHGYKQTGQSVRLKSENGCVYCQRIDDQKRYKRKMHTQGKIVPGCNCENCLLKQQKIEQVLSLNTFDTVEFYLGTLCKCKHDYMETGLSLRKLNRRPGSTRGNFCVECNLEWVKNWEPKDRDTYNFQKAAASHKRRAKKKSNVHVKYTESDKLERYKLFDNACAYCGTDKAKLTVEHVIAINNNGHDALYNIIPACGRCNRSKGDRDLYIWYPQKSYFDQRRLNLIESLIDFVMQGDVNYSPS